jgi:metal-sulfur cluster biosynthetic enzyme
MTLTTPACPLAGSFEFLVKNNLSELPDLDSERDVVITLTFDPPWTQEMMTDELKAQFGFDEW